MGCIGYSRRYFPKGQMRKDAFQEAVLAARRELQSIEHPYREFGWQQAVGSSGTIRATAEILRVNERGDDGITPAGLKWIRKALVAAGRTNDVRLLGLKAERAPVYPGGLAILQAIFESLGIERMDVASGALREGVLYDLLGRIRHEDVRERTIAAFQTRYHVDKAQAARVERRALALLLHTAEAWSLDPVEAGRLLAWAARLHEVGLAVSYTRYHHHGAYLVANSDLPGFSRDDLAILAALIRAHRRKLRPEAFQAVPPRMREQVKRLAVLLRIAVLLNRSRGPVRLPEVRLEADGDTLRVACPEGWAEAYPLSHRDLQAEVAQFARVGMALRISNGESTA
jgi:exopolyphosphatase/guanosine-5'-triphosphate,3'-diphosphate pyrophosphatase